MYTSFYGQGFPNSKGKKNQHNAPPTSEELSAGIDNQPCMQLSQRILDGKAVVSVQLLLLNNQHLVLLGETSFDRYKFHCLPRSLQTGVPGPPHRQRGEN